MPILSLICLAVPVALFFGAKKTNRGRYAVALPLIYIGLMGTAFSHIAKAHTNLVLGIFCLLCVLSCVFVRLGAGRDSSSDSDVSL